MLLFDSLLFWFHPPALISSRLINFELQQAATKMWQTHCTLLVQQQTADTHSQWVADLHNGAFSSWRAGYFTQELVETKSRAKRRKKLEFTFIDTNTRNKCCSVSAECVSRLSVTSQYVLTSPPCLISDRHRPLVPTEEVNLQIFVSHF